MKVYVASAFGDFPRARAAMAYLRAHGVTITCDWTIGAEGGELSGEGTDCARALLAVDDLEGVENADIVLVLTPEANRKDMGCGMWVEYGHALALSKVVVMTGGQRERTIFCSLATRCDSDPEALEFIVNDGPGMLLEEEAQTERSPTSSAA